MLSRTMKHAVVVLLNCPGRASFGFRSNPRKKTPASTKEAPAVLSRGPLLCRAQTLTENRPGEKVLLCGKG